MGSLFKSKSEAVVDPGAQEAFNIAKPSMQFANTQGVNLAQQVMQNPAFSGQRVADLNPFQTSSANNLGSFANNTAGLGYGLMNTGLGSLGASSAVGANAADIFGRSSMDPTQQIINQAGMFANNPYVDGMIDASGRDVSRQLNEQTLPSLARGFAGTGNTNSSRAGVESAIAQRGAADRLADISSGIRGQFFGKGMDLAQNQYNQNLTNMMNANQGLLGAGQFGAGLVGAGQDFSTNAFAQGQNAGGLFQNQEQNVIQGNMNQFNESIQNPLSVLQALSGIAGNTQAKTAAGVSTQPSIASQIGGAMMAAGSMGFKPFSDIRMKENIVKVGNLPSGVGVYKYDYKPEFKDIAGHGRFVGVMAQEAAQVYPDAIEMQSNGYFAVDYSKIH